VPPRHVHADVVRLQVVLWCVCVMYTFERSYVVCGGMRVNDIVREPWRCGGMGHGAWDRSRAKKGKVSFAANLDGPVSH
jgi:hypothetical protein